MKKIIACFFIYAVLLSGASRAFAQNSKAAAPVSVKFTVMAWDVFDPEKDLELNYTTRGKLCTMQAVWRDRSPVMECDGAGALVFTRTVEVDKKKVELPVATANIPQGMTRVLLVFGRNASPAPGESSVRVMVIDDSYTIFPGKSVRFLNYSRMTLGGSLGEQKFEVAPGGDWVVPATLPEANRLLPFRLARRDETGAWKKLRSTGLPMTAGLRVLVFLIDDPARPGRAEMVLLRDHVEIELERPTKDLVTGTLGLRVNPRIR